MPMKEPPHPGLSVRHDCLEPLGLTITDGAKVLGVSRQALNDLVNGKGGISSGMAIRLDKAFGDGGSRDRGGGPSRKSAHGAPPRTFSH